MPHAVSKGLGLQALILCGPGSSFPTFTASPDENPKALLPIANRPMVWYPLDFCYRAGITDITLICPPAAAEAIKTALKTNPFLTSLSAPAVLAPKDLDQTTGTAAILRLPEVRSLVVADFVVLPCDLVCELGGEKLLQAWMARAASLGDILGAEEPDISLTLGGTAGGSGSCRSAAQHSGGLGVWYDTRTGLPSVKSEEKDFVATVPLPGTSTLPKTSAASTTATKSSSASLLPHLEQVVTAMPADSLNDLTEDKDGYPVRHGLLRRHRRVRMRTTHRDAHIYVFPQWVVDFVQQNEHMDSIGEDVLGWWSKAQWQPALPKKLRLDKVLQNYGALCADSEDDEAAGGSGKSQTEDGGTATEAHADGRPTVLVDGAVDAAAATAAGDATMAETAASSSSAAGPVPPLLAYIHPSTATAPLIRRVDTSQLLLTVSLQLAKLPSLEEVAAGTADSSTASPFAHAKKVAYPEGVKPRTTVTRPDSLVAENVTVEEKVSIKECVVGANCQIHEGAKLHQCLLMEGVVVGKGCRLTRCILGKRSEIGAASVLTDCEVQENLLVEPKTEEKDNNFMSSEGLEATTEEMGEAMEDVDDGRAAA